MKIGFAGSDDFSLKILSGLTEIIADGSALAESGHSSGHCTADGAYADGSLEGARAAGGGPVSS